MGVHWSNQWFTYLLIMLAGGIVEIGSFGALTIAVGFAEASGLALIADGLARTSHEAQDSHKWSTGHNNRANPPADYIPNIPSYDDAYFQEWVTKQGNIELPLPTKPDELLNHPEWKETTHPDAGKHGHRTFENQQTGEIIRHDQGKPGFPGHKGRDHYHREVPNQKGSYDYVDAFGNPVPKNSEPAHLYPPTKPSSQ